MLEVANPFVGLALALNDLLTYVCQAMLPRYLKLVIYVNLIIDINVMPQFTSRLLQVLEVANPPVSRFGFE